MGRLNHFRGEIAVATRSIQEEDWMSFRHLLFVIGIALLLLPGCSKQKAKEAIVKQLVEQSRKLTDVNKGFQLVDGEAVYLDWNTGEGKIVRKLPDADPATFAAVKQPRDAWALFAVDKNNVFVAQYSDVHR